MCDGGRHAYVPAPGTTSGKTKDGTSVFPKEKFRYDAMAEVYHCPGGHALPFQKQNLNRGQPRGLYYDRAACRSCPLRKECTTGSCRVIGRHAQEAAVEATAARVLAAPEKVAERKEIVEHVFGTLRLWGHDEFLMKGLGKVKGEFSLSAVVYNLRRVLNLRSVPELLAAVRALAAATAGRPLTTVPAEKCLPGEVFKRGRRNRGDPAQVRRARRTWRRGRLGAPGRQIGRPAAVTRSLREFSHSL